MNFKNLAMWGIIVILTIGLYNMFKNPQGSISQKNKIIFSEFLTEVDNGRVVKVEIQGKNIKGVLSNGNQFTTYAPEDPNLIQKLSDKGVSISASPLEEKMPSLLGILLSWFPMLLLIAVWIFFMRQMQGGKGGAMGFGRSKAKMMNEVKGKVTLPFNSFIILALDLPKPIAPPFPPCICLIKNIQTAISNNIGNHERRTPNKDGIFSSIGAAEILTPFSESFSIKLGSFGA
jgi:hypothetical protein